VFPCASLFITGKTSPVPIGHVAGWNALEKRKVPCSWLELKPISTNIKYSSWIIIIIIVIIIIIIIIIITVLSHYPL
jgi:hypothetical protein